MKYYYKPTSLHDLIQHSEKEHAKLPYVHEYIDGNYHSKSYQEFIDDVRRFATLLNSLGYHGKSIILYGKNSYEWMVAYMAITAYVGICICTGKDWKCYDMDNVFSVVSPSLLICDDGLRQYTVNANGFEICDLKDLFNKSKDCKVNEVSLDSVAIGKKDVSIIIFTTGTTGKPKAVPLSLAKMFACGESLYDRVLTTPDDSYYLFLPLHHIYCQFGIMLAAFDIGASLYLSSDLRNFLEEVKAGQPTIIPGVPLFFERILNGFGKNNIRRISSIVSVMNLLSMPVYFRRKLFSKVHKAFGGNVRLFVSSAAQLDSSSKSLFVGMGFSLIEAYGMSETSGVVSIEDESATPVIGSMGKILSPQKVEINNPGVDGYGEVLIKGDNVTDGYLLDGKTDKSKFNKNGYFATGDEGFVDKNGNLFIRGRIGKVIVLSSGEKVSVDEITGLLKSKNNIDKVYLRDKNGYLDATIFSHDNYDGVDAKIESLNEKLPKYKQIKSWTLVNDYVLSEIKK